MSSINRYPGSEPKNGRHDGLVVGVVILIALLMFAFAAGIWLGLSLAGGRA